jgi:hypothetical protein
MSRLETQTVKRIEAGETERTLQAQAKCPKCDTWGDVDEDQFAGLVSLICGVPDCGWHGYIDGREA